MNNKTLENKMDILKQDIATLRQDVEELSEELKGILTLIRKKKC